MRNRLVAVLFFVSSSAFAQDAQGGPGGRGGPNGGPGGHHGPPPEALAACEGKAANAACSFKGRDREVTGTCFAPEGKPLACRPSGPPPGER